METRRAGSGTWHLPLPSLPPSITPRSSADIDRRVANPGETAYTSQTERRTLQFTDFRPLEIRLVRIRYAS
jgi:hypothetical protein